MAEVFAEILNMSLTGSVVILLVLAVRLLLKRAPKIYSYALWAVVLFRLLCPVALSAPVSVLEWLSPKVEEATAVTSVVAYRPVEAVYSGSQSRPEPDRTEYTQPSETVQVQEQEVVSAGLICAWIWLGGMCILALHSLVQYIQLRQKLIGSTLYRGNVYLADHIASPFVLGVVSPRVYLPSDTPIKERRYIIAHERHHIRRGDHVIKLLAYGALCIHWFNPLVWISFQLAGKDMEMSCDEAVIKKLGSHIRADYSASLLRLATGRRILSGTPLAFGEGDTKGRVINMAKWKKPKLWVSILCLILCVAVLAACAVNPEQAESYMESTVREGTWDGQFKLELPEGYEFSRDEAGNMVFTDGTNIIGGKRDYIAPEGYIFADYFSREFLLEMGLPEATDESLGHSAGGSLGGTGSDGWTAEYFSDVPPGTAPTVHSFHQFFVMEDGIHIIDIWFDLLVVDAHTKNAILDSIEIPEIGRFAKTSREQAALTIFSEETINILITGFADETAAGTPDMQFLLSVHPDLHKVTLASFLKDTYVSLPNYQGHVTGNNKFSVCYVLGKAWGGTEGAAEMVNQCIKDNFGITVDHNMELAGKQYAGLMDILNDIAGKLGTNVRLDSEFQEVSDRLLSMIAGSEDPEEIRRAREKLAAAQWEDCTIPFEGTYMGQEMDIGGKKVMVLVMQEPQTGEQEVPANYPVLIGELPAGYSHGLDGDGNVIFIEENRTVGGIALYPIPEGVYDPDDAHFDWLEKVGIPDFEDPDLVYTGGITSGDNGWAAEFADDVSDEANCTVYRRHTFQVIGATVYDIWFDMLSIGRDTASEIQWAVQLPKPVPAEPEEKTPENIAFEKSKAIMDAVSNGSCHIIGLQEQEGTEGPRGYERTYLYHQGDFLYTNRLLTEGENITEAGNYYNRYALMIVGDEWFSNAGHQGEQGEIIWEKAEPVDPSAPWLGNRVWNRTYVSYIDTLTDASGTCYMFRYDKPFEDRADYDGHYFVNFNFDAEGNFLSVKLQVNLFRENGFTITETILSLDPEAVNTQIQQEYQRAKG